MELGGHKVNRVRNELNNPELRMQRLAPKTNSSAVTEADIEHIKENAKDWVLEDGFVCSHCRQKQYFVQPPNKEEKLTWTKLHELYKQYCTGAKTMWLSYSRWLQYVHFIFPARRTARSQADLCDICEEINVLLESSDISAEYRAELEELKATHIDKVIGQRRAMQSFIREFTRKFDVNLQLPEQFIPEELEGNILSDDEDEIEQAETVESNAVNADPYRSSNVTYQIEDDGGGQPIPCYGIR